MNSDMKRNVFNALAGVKEVLAWVGPIVNGRSDQWKAERLQACVDLANEIEPTMYQAEPAEWSWYVPMTEKQAAKMVAGIKSTERFQLGNLAIETVVYDQAKGELTVTFPKGTMNPSELRERVSCYVNGFYAAVSNS
jgi:hypothetical protein